MNEPDFDGETYVEGLDKVRLTSQLRKVYEAMSDGQWRTLRALSRITGSSESSVSARLRDLRKQKFGGRDILRERVSKGLYHYRVNTGGAVV